MNLLLDASLPPRLARALHQLAQPTHRVEHVRDVLGNDASDLLISDHLAQHAETALISIDLQTTSTPHRLENLRATRRPVMLLHESWMTLNAWDLSWQLAAVFPDMIRRISASAQPSIFLVPRHEHGRIRKVS